MSHWKPVRASLTHFFLKKPVCHLYLISSYPHHYHHQATSSSRWLQATCLCRVLSGRLLNGWMNVVNAEHSVRNGKKTMGGSLRCRQRCRCKAEEQSSCWVLWIVTLDSLALTSINRLFKFSFYLLCKNAGHRISQSLSKEETQIRTWRHQVQFPFCPLLARFPCSVSLVPRFSEPFLPLAALN